MESVRNLLSKIEPTEIQYVEKEIRESIKRGSKHLQIISLSDEMISYLQANGCRVRLDQTGLEPMYYNEEGYDDDIGIDSFAPEIYNIDLDNAANSFLQEMECRDTFDKNLH
ncbi:MAG: hypothetical protein FWE47_01630 [Oscillospiraceae bacterium]|nr:hypothetical protein [Oscillospiraceae bacterium]